MSESLFGDLDVASAEDNPFAVPDNTYNCYIDEIKTGETKPKDDGSTKFGMTIIYKIDGGDHNGKTIREWKEILTPVDPRNLTPSEEKSRSFLKQRLQSFGIPTDKMNSVSPDDLIGLRVVVSTATNDKGYVGVRRVTLPNDDPFAS